MQAAVPPADKQRHTKALTSRSKRGLTSTTPPSSIGPDKHQDYFNNFQK